MSSVGLFTALDPIVLQRSAGNRAVSMMVDAQCRTDPSVSAGWCGLEEGGPSDDQLRSDVQRQEAPEGDRDGDEVVTLFGPTMVPSTIRMAVPIALAGGAPPSDSPAALTASNGSIRHGPASHHKVQRREMSWT